ncbi:MAG: dolichyl-phosphate beta-D-mannosyltransferase [Proteobacteria bacterium SG_bin7]|nr:MAG: dolichyl-phosphate beta-D-mannosyltransferase [Proteobacteria bacterium SG_bin7]
MKSLVVVPTYNEKENIVRLAPTLLALLPDIEILVVDDNSPDGTAQVVNEMKMQFPHVHLLLRAEKQGLGRAYLDGFAWGLQRGFQVIVEMDADFSHRPDDLRKLIEALKDPTIDFVVGSRYIKGGGIEKWTYLRMAISRFGSLYSRWVLGFPLKDWTGGFNGWKREVLEKIELQKIISNGYCFQIEMKYRALKKGFRGKEVPITFANRHFGKSKMSLKVFVEAFYKIWVIRNV